MWMESWCSFNMLNSIFLEIAVEVGTGLMFALFATQKKVAGFLALNLLAGR